MTQQRTKAPPPFIVLWREALRRRSGLPPAVRHVGHVMADYADTDTGASVFPSADRIAEETGLSRRHVSDCRRRLARAGFALEIRKGGSPKGEKRQNSLYRLTIPPAPTTELSSPVAETTTELSSPVLVNSTTPTGELSSHYRSMTGSPTSPEGGSSTTTAPTAASGEGVGAGGASPTLASVLAKRCKLSLPDMTKSARATLEKAATELSDVGATPIDVRRRADVYVEKHPSWQLTPKALAAHWAALRPMYEDLEYYERDDWRDWFGTKEVAAARFDSMSDAERREAEDEMNQAVRYVDHLEDSFGHLFDALEDWAQKDLILGAGGKRKALEYLAAQPNFGDRLVEWRAIWEALSPSTRAELEKDREHDYGGKYARLAFPQLPKDERDRIVERIEIL